MKLKYLFHLFGYGKVLTAQIVRPGGGEASAEGLASELAVATEAEADLKALKFN